MRATSLASLPATETLQLFKVLADETRLAMLRLLALTDLRGGELVKRLGLPHNAISYHLKQLRELGILRDHRSHADARDIYYCLDFTRLQLLYQRAGQALHPMLALQAEPLATTEGDGPPSTERPIRVLFLCTHNSARSQLAEAILRWRGGERVEVASAGSEPTRLHPLAAALLQQHAIEPSLHRAKSLDEFVEQPFNYVITVCDRVNDDCPIFLGDPLRLHWSFPDPTIIEDVGAREQTFATIWVELNLRIGHLLNLLHPDIGRSPAAAGHPVTREEPC